MDAPSANENKEIWTGYLIRYLGPGNLHGQDPARVFQKHFYSKEDAEEFVRRALVDQMCEMDPCGHYSQMWDESFDTVTKEARRMNKGSKILPRVLNWGVKLLEIGRVWDVRPGM